MLFPLLFVLEVVVEVDEDNNELEVLFRDVLVADEETTTADGDDALDVKFDVVSNEKTTLPPEAKDAETAAAAPDTMPWKSSESSWFRRSRRMSWEEDDWLLELGPPSFVRRFFNLRVESDGLEGEGEEVAVVAVQVVTQEVVI